MWLGSVSRDHQNLGISWRFFLILCLVAVVGMGSFAAMLDRIIVPTHLLLMEQRVRTLGEELRQIVPYLSSEENQRLLEKIQLVEPDLSYLLVYDRQCRAVVHSNPQRVGMVFDDPQSLMSCRDGREVRQIYRRDAEDPTSPFHNEQVIDMNLPLYDLNGVHIGAISLGLSLRSLEALQSRYRWLFSGGALLVALAFFLVAALHMAEVRPILKKLSDSENTYRTLFEDSANPLAFIAEDMSLSLINKEFERICGYSVEDVMQGGVFWPTFVALPEDLERMKFYHIQRRLDPQGAPCSYEFRFRSRQGVERDVMITVGIIPGTRKSLAMLVDISDRKMQERERERLLAELAQKNDELESIVYVASHDLRSPLINIQGFSKNLEKYCHQIGILFDEPVAPDKIRDAALPLVQEKMPTALRYISASGTKMGNLLDGLLLLSRAGRVTLHFETIDMERLVEAVVRATSPLVQKIGASVVVGELPTCWGDDSQVQQIFTNLLDNALKYRDPQRPLRVEIRGEILQDTVRFVVEDNGKGIAAEHVDKIWMLFHRLDPQGSESGDGLGLTLVRRIVDRLRGRIWVESQRGEGSRFFLELPYAP